MSGAENRYDGPNATLAISEFLVRTRDLPEYARQAARLVILDTIGCMLGGSTTAEGRKVREMVQAMGECHEATLVGKVGRSSPYLAAFHNGFLARLLQLDDTHRTSLNHVGSSIVAAALALAEARDRPGAEMERAVVLGYEVAVRVSLAVQPSHWQRGFDAAGTCNALGAAAAAGVLVELDAPSMANALGFAGTQAGGLLESRFAREDLSRPLNVARAAANGVMAALMAERGLAGPEDILDGHWGFLRSFSDGADPAPLAADLGRRYAVTEAGFRVHACRRYHHSTVDALLSLRPRIPRDPDSIREIRVRIFDRAAAAGNPAAPATPQEARGSIPYTLAVALLEGSVRPAYFAPDRLANPARIRLAEKVRVAADPELTAAFPGRWGSIVEVDLATGEQLSARVDTPKGEPEDPLSQEELLDKFYSLAAPAVGLHRAGNLAGCIEQLSGLQSTRSLRLFIV